MPTQSPFKEEWLKEEDRVRYQSRKTYKYKPAYIYHIDWEALYDLKLKTNWNLKQLAESTDTSVSISWVSIKLREVEARRQI